MSAAASLWGLRSVLACLGLSFGLIASCAASVAEGLDILLPGWTGFGGWALRRSLRLCGRGTVGAAWGLIEARVFSRGSS